jgi:hypothetical protein
MLFKVQNVGGKASPGSFNFIPTSKEMDYLRGIGS